MSKEGERAILSVFIIREDESTDDLTTKNKYHELYQNIFDKREIDLPVTENAFLDSF